MTFVDRKQNVTKYNHIINVRNSLTEKGRRERY